MVHTMRCRVHSSFTNLAQPKTINRKKESEQEDEGDGLRTSHCDRPMPLVLQQCPVDSFPTPFAFRDWERDLKRPPRGENPLGMDYHNQPLGSTCTKTLTTTLTTRSWNCPVRVPIGTPLPALLTPVHASVAESVFVRSTFMVSYSTPTSQARSMAMSLC